MGTIAQISATFIAITAGFYTTKIISIMNDKARLKGKKTELETEKATATTIRDEYQKQIDSIQDEDDKELIIYFRYRIVKDVVYQSYRMEKFEDLIPKFEEYFDFKPGPNQERLLREQFEDIKREVLEVLEKQKIKEQKMRQRIQNLRLDNVIPDEILASLPKSPEKKIQDELGRQTDRQIEIERFDRLKDEKNNAQDKITLSEKLLQVVNQEINAVVTPKHIHFGFLSFIVFAILGVIIPLTYGSWEGIAESVRGFHLPININYFMILLFCIGLLMNFVYIYLELHAATIT